MHGEHPLKFFWHIHHGILCEGSTNIAERVEYIKREKPAFEVETRLRLLTEVKNPERLPREWREADAKRQEAYTKRREAYAKWDEAYAEWVKAYAKLREANAKLREADVKLREANAKLREANAKWDEAYAKWREADAKWREAEAKFRPELEALHREEHPECQWNGRTIFP